MADHIGMKKEKPRWSRIIGTKRLHTKVDVGELPNCVFSNTSRHIFTVKAKYDALLPNFGSWAEICQDCFTREGCDLGLGKGQELNLTGKDGEENVENR